jgi:hypothetical protein
MKTFVMATVGAVASVIAAGITLLVVSIGASTAAVGVVWFGVGGLGLLAGLVLVARLRTAPRRAARRAAAMPVTGAIAVRSV